MGGIFDPLYTGGDFKLFGTAHIVSLVIILLVCLLFIPLRRVLSEKARLVLRWVMIVIIFVDALSWHWWNWAIGYWDIYYMLPLHLCSVFGFLSGVLLITKNQTLFEFTYFLGMGGALQALFTPDIGIYGFPHFVYFQTFITHGMIIVAVFYMAFVEGFRPHWTATFKVMLVGNLYLVFIFFLNKWIGSNYLFINFKPPTESILDLFGDWPWYILTIEGVALLEFIIFYLPWAAIDQVRRLGKKSSALNINP
jgi:hypothetical integral membrane protein (TIGR02206 family)